MPNIPQLARLREERATCEKTITEILEGVGEERDVSDAEMTQVKATRERIEKLDAQIEPLQELEERMNAHAETVAAIQPTVRRSDETRITARAREVVYPSAGDFMVDLVRSFENAPRQLADLYSPDAAQRVSAALGRAAGDVAAGLHQTTEDTPGLLPKNIVGQIVTDLDEVRPLISALGAKDLAGIPGKTFSRPVVDRTVAPSGDGKQSAEKAEGHALEVKINGVDFTKATFLRWMNISRQEIDWTSPAAWDNLIGEMMAVYAEDTEDDTAAKLAAAVTQTEAVAADTISGWIAALYAARAKVVSASGTRRARARRLPNAIFTAYDMDSSLGALIDAHLAMNFNAVGEAGLDKLGGSILKLPRIMSPGLPEGTVILGRKDGFEFYEQRIGLLQAVEPKVLGVEVSYGGYTASGAVDASLFCKLTAPVGP